jgi:hypothetical protein
MAGAQPASQDAALMSLPYIVDGETEASSTVINTWIDAMNGKGPGGLFSIEAYGATNDSATDSTDAVTDAWDAATEANGVLYVPPGDWRYEGDGLSGWETPSVLGAGRLSSRIVLPDGGRFLDEPATWLSLSVQRCWFDGGAGAIRNRRTASNVSHQLAVLDCTFQNYTEAAIESNSSDMPLWKIQRNYFRATDTDASIGVALSGWVDSSSIVDNSFVLNRVAVKLGSGGVNAKIGRNDFLRFTDTRDGGPCVDVWLVPAEPVILSGWGCSITENKFGNEHLITGDYRIVVADEGAGDTFGTRMPVLGTVSEGEVSGVMLDHNNWVGGTSSGDVPFVYSTTPNIRHWSLGTTGVLGMGGINVVPFLFHADAVTDAAAFVTTRHEGLLMDQNETSI